MLAYLDGQKTAQLEGPLAESSTLICFCKADEEEKMIQMIDLDTSSDAISSPGNATRYETHNGFDYLSIHTLDFDHLPEHAPPVHFYLTATKLLMVTEQDRIIDKLSGLIDNEQIREPTASKVLYYFFNILFTGDSDFLEDIEEELEVLEQRVVQEKPDDCTTALIDIRKKILVLKRYYESLYDLLVDLEENLNGFFPSKQLRSFRMHTNRADRLSNSVLNLREYATQVREAYQNQLDINLNQTMRLFTVITAIFLPLTLLVGWYGMNLQMPEFSMPHIYPVIIAISIIIVVVLLIYFKIRKWY